MILTSGAPSMRGLDALRLAAHRDLEPLVLREGEDGPVAVVETVFSPPPHAAASSTSRRQSTAPGAGIVTGRSESG